MTHKTVMKCAMVLALLVCWMVQASAQSTVYFITRNFTNMEKGVLSYNGEAIGSFLTSRNLKRNSPRLLQYNPSYRKCVLKDEGKVVLRADMQFFTTDMDGNKTSTRPMAAEIQLTLSEGSVHYVYLSLKGANDIKMEEVSEKDARKLMGKKKCVMLPDYVEQ